ncbi:hypothetical protein PVAND_014557 [Polypedilum vanderplanki]|uniref:Metalloendopeptidase n=1 Tax=Polypedilum vanderplanki TaxID=319348 RepID=A0A9J6B9I8_POLVA|nr:hypothetical protein PVAND_014557 [Polypedilum vanderplanki]
MSKNLFLFLLLAFLIAIASQAPIRKKNDKNQIKLKNKIKIDEEEQNDNDFDDDESENDSEEDSNEKSDEDDDDDDSDFKRDDDEIEDFYDEEEIDEALIFDNEGENDGEGGTGILDKKRFWPKTGDFVTVPYKIDLKAGISNERKKRIEAGLKRIEKRTCIKFKKHGDEKNYIKFTSTPTKGCTSPVGMHPDKPNQINLNVAEARCYKIGTIMHETIHSLGFFHMQSHTERDKYVDILWDNVQGGVKNHNMRALSNKIATNFETKYDFFSVMHYGPGMIKPKKKYSYYADFMGQRRRLSDGDVDRINKMYECDKKYWTDAPDDYNDVADDDEENNSEQEGNDDDSENESEEED